MLGFSISIYPEELYIRIPRYWEREKARNALLARWDTSVWGIKWLKDLKNEGKVGIHPESDHCSTQFTCALSVISEILAGHIPLHDSHHSTGMAAAHRDGSGMSSSTRTASRGLMAILASSLK